MKTVLALPGRKVQPLAFRSRSRALALDVIDSFCSHTIQAMGEPCAQVLTTLSSPRSVIVVIAPI